MSCLTAFREFDPRMLVTVPDGVYRWWEAWVCKVADGYIDHVRQELTVPIDGAAASRAEIGIEPFAGVGYATPRGTLTTGFFNSGLRPVTRIGEGAPRSTLAFKAATNSVKFRVTRYDHRQLTARTNCSSFHNCPLIR